MIIIIGLGNPGEKFKNTRHNAGFLVLDEFAKINNFESFKLQKKITAEISSAFVKTSADKEEEVLLVKPQTFMNESGKSVQKIISNLKFQISNLIVVHDDIDLPVGEIKIVKNRGSAGHKGVESIIKELDSSDFIRFRIGIALQKEIKAKKIVLKNFSKEEQKIMKVAVSKTAKALEFCIQNGPEKTMNEYNK
jgi:PTH1 family peptidyl-tRNA hydrolase